MGITAVPYNLSRWKNTLCSTCELFTSKDYAYMPVGRIIRSGGMRVVREYYRSFVKNTGRRTLRGLSCLFDILTISHVPFPCELLLRGYVSA